MGKINILQPKVFNMLAAGEVVENPASVVKELVENSLDAGATEIDITVEQGGIRKIQVSDNGIGILKEDIRNAFVPHATSKINNIDDLDSLSTLGFRGEALASIASISEIILISASKQQNTATKIVLKGGSIVSEMPDSRSSGTIITVENIFFNTPARLKFLKKPAQEMRGITDIVRMLILSNPSASFSLTNEDGELLHHEAGSLADAVCAVYGTKSFDNLLEITDDNKGPIKVKGFISSCDYMKPNRTYQTVIVNGRSVSDVTVQTAVEKAYGDYLMKRTYPMFILDIIMPFEEVDVNVHPRKSEIRFFDKQKVFGAVYHAVQKTIDESLGKSSYGFNTGNEIKNVFDSVATDSESVKKTEVKSKNAYEQTKIDTSCLYQGKTAPVNFPYAFEDKKPRAFRETASIFDDETLSPSAFVREKVLTDNHSAIEKLANLNEISLMPEETDIFDGKVIGQAFATYLLVERDEKLYIIDQHAAHERILYDRIAQRCQPQYSQPLIAPYKLSLSASDEENLERLLPTLKSLGFEIECVNSSYQVKAVPEAVSEISLTKFFGDLFANAVDEDELTLAGLLKDKLCQQACKAAIKGGEVLSKGQIQQVIKNYVDENGNLPIKCPHGRPAVIALSKRDFEKMFKRIV